MTGLIEQCLQLPQRERKELYAALRDSLCVEQRRSRCLDRGKILLEKMAGIIGEPILLKSRESRSVWARAMVAYELITEGFTTTDIGMVIARDHSSVTWLNHNMEIALAYPGMYLDVVNIWNQFQTNLQNETYRRTD